VVILQVGGCVRELTTSHCKKKNRLACYKILQWASKLLLTYLLTYSLHGAGYYLKSWLSFILSKNIPPSYGTRRFITMFTKARHRTLFWASWIQFATSISVSLRSSLMLSSHLCLRLSGSLLLSGFPTKTLYTSPLPHVCYMSSPPNPPWFSHPNKWSLIVNFDYSILLKEYEFSWNTAETKFLFEMDIHVV
jgi:hypothetical protein